MIVWSPLATANDCCACGAGFQLESPAWLASITQVPTPMNDTVALESFTTGPRGPRDPWSVLDETTPFRERGPAPPEIVHTPLAEASMVKVTARPDDAVAVTL